MAAPGTVLFRSAPAGAMLCDGPDKGLMRVPGPGCHILQLFHQFVASVFVRYLPDQAPSILNPVFLCPNLYLGKVNSKKLVRLSFVFPARPKLVPSRDQPRHRGKSAAHVHSDILRLDMTVRHTLDELSVP